MPYISVGRTAPRNHAHTTLAHVVYTHPYFKYPGCLASTMMHTQHTYIICAHCTVHTTDTHRHKHTHNINVQSRTNPTIVCYPFAAHVVWRSAGLCVVSVCVPCVCVCSCVILQIYFSFRKPFPLILLAPYIRCINPPFKCYVYTTVDAQRFPTST